MTIKKIALVAKKIIHTTGVDLVPWDNFFSQNFTQPIPNCHQELQIAQIINHTKMQIYF